MKTIIVATEYSAAAHQATEYAAHLAKKMEAKIILVHAFQRPTLISTTLEVNSLHQLTIWHKEKLTVISQKITHEFGIPVEEIAACGVLPEILAEVVKQKGAGLVVIGMQSMSNIERLIIGSTTITILEEATYPLLIVPQMAAFRPLKTLLFACEYHYLTGHTILPALKELALAFGAEVEVLHVEEPELVAEKIEERVKTGQHLDRLFKGVKHKYIFLEKEDVAEGIQNTIQSHPANLLAMVPREHRIWDKIFNNSTTRKLVWHTHIPILIIPVQQ